MQHNESNPNTCEPGYFLFPPNFFHHLVKINYCFAAITIIGGTMHNCKSFWMKFCQGIQQFRGIVGIGCVLPLKALFHIQA